jgi:hypothetical protein
MIRLSLDFDGTLRDDSIIQEIARNLMNREDVELFITTRRYSHNDETVEVYKASEVFNIPRENCTFCNRQMKASFLVDNDIDIHIDDDLSEFVYQGLTDKCKIIYSRSPHLNIESLNNLINQLNKD